MPASSSSARAVDDVVGALPGRAVEAHVQPLVGVEGEPALRVQELVRADAQVGQQHVEAVRGRLAGHLQRAAEPGAYQAEGAGGGFGQPGLGNAQGAAVGVQADQQAVRADGLREGEGVAAGADGQVEGAVAGAGLEDLEHLGDHGRFMNRRPVAWLNVLQHDHGP